MSYLNLNNMCIFQGNLVADPVFKLRGEGKNQFTVARFKVAVEKNMTKQQKENAKKNNYPTADFPEFEVLGPKAKLMEDYPKFYSKGCTVKVVASFKNNNYIKKETDEKVYGFLFEVVDVNPVFSSTGNGNSNNNGGGSKAKEHDEFEDFESVDIEDGEIPF